MKDAVPSWSVVATSDLMIHPDAQRFHGRARGIAHALEEIDASHSVAVSHRRAVVDLIPGAIGQTTAVGIA